MENEKKQRVCARPFVHWDGCDCANDSTRDRSPLTKAEREAIDARAMASGRGQFPDPESVGLRSRRAAQVRQQAATRGLAALVDPGTMGKLCAAAFERGCTARELATVLLTAAADGFARPSSWEHDHACALVGSLDR